MFNMWEHTKVEQSPKVKFIKPKFQNLYYKKPINDVAFNVQFHIQIGYENGLIWTKTLKWATNCSIFATKKVMF